MTPWYARTILEARKARIRAYNNVRFHFQGYEYRLTYEGGFFGFLTVHKRPEWKHRGRFEYVDTFAEDDIHGDVIDFVKSKIGG